VKALIPHRAEDGKSLLQKIVGKTGQVCKPALLFLSPPAPLAVVKCIKGTAGILRTTSETLPEVIAE